MIFRWIFFSSVFFFTSAFAASLTLFNDTPFTLTARIYPAGSSSSIDAVKINSQQTKHWTNYGGRIGTVSKSQTPYTITWTCPDGEMYSSSSSVPTGATVTASSGEGPKSCKYFPKPVLFPSEEGNVHSESSGQ